MWDCKIGANRVSFAIDKPLTVYANRIGTRRPRALGEWSGTRRRTSSHVTGALANEPTSSSSESTSGSRSLDLQTAAVSWAAAIRAYRLPGAYRSVQAKGLARSSRTNALILLARPKRFELLTPRFVVWCSIQLSYGRASVLSGARNAASRNVAGV
jgi:hypothetical protein